MVIGFQDLAVAAIAVLEMECILFIKSSRDVSARDLPIFIVVRLFAPFLKQYGSTNQMSADKRGASSAGP